MTADDSRTSNAAASEHPYRRQPARAFWRNVVEGRAPEAITDWYRAKWPIGKARVATAGSCFAQHIGRRLRENGFRYIDAEPAPPGISPANAAAWGFGQYSARYGNVYTARQLLQLVQRATGEFVPAEPAWQRPGGYCDPFRPTIDGAALSSPEEVEACRASHLAAVRGLFERTEVFVFTLGLTEAWCSAEDGAVFPLCPGTQGGVFDANRHRFANFAFHEVYADMQAFLQRARALNPRMRFLLTVSPVPLAATATQHQVVVATSHSKAVLRAVAGQLAERYWYVDYFPSFEIVSSHCMRGNAYEPDMRGVRPQAVEHVMAQFFAEHAPPAPRAASAESAPEPDVACDEALLAAFGERP